MDTNQTIQNSSTFVRCCSFIFTPKAQHFILGIIILNAIILGLETSTSIMATVGGFLLALDTICLWIFIIEIGMKLVCVRLRFFKSAWNVFDFIIVAIALVPSSGPLSILRALRILRVLRLITNLPRLRIIVEAILQSLPGIGWISGLLVLVFYIFGVLCTTLFGAAFPEWFGSLGESFYTLFQILTLESWSMGIVRPVMEKFPYAYAIFIPFILLTAFIVLNVFIGIIVNSLSEVAAGDKDSLTCVDSIDKVAATDESTLKHELAMLKKQIAKVEILIDRHTTD